MKNSTNPAIAQLAVDNMLKVLILAVDYGMGYTKFAFKFGNKLYKRHFESRVSYERAFSATTTTINNKDYVFGEGQFAVDLGHNTKDHEIHRLLMYKAMIDAYKITKQTRFKLAVTCSLDSYKVDRGTSVRNFMLEKREITFKEDGVEATLYIEDIQCYPECLVGALTTDLKLKKEDVIVIDLGTRNLQLLRILMGNPEIDKSYSTLHGCDSLYIAIGDNAKALNIGLDTPDAIKMYLTRTGEGTYPEIPEIEDIILKHLEVNIFSDIDKKLKILGSSLFTKFIFVGGGAVYFKRFLEAKYNVDDKALPVKALIKTDNSNNSTNIDNTKTSFVKDPFYANSLGLLKKAQKVFAEAA